MQTASKKRAIGIALTILAISAAFWFARPSPVPVDLATVATGPMEVTIDDDAKTRVRHIYTVSAPIAGKVRGRAVQPAVHRLERAGALRFD